MFVRNNFYFTTKFIHHYVKRAQMHLRKKYIRKMYKLISILDSTLQIQLKVFVHPTSILKFSTITTNNNQIS